MRRLLLIILALAIFSTLGVGHADSSLKLGSILIGWDKLQRTDSSFSSAQRLIDDYALQIGHSCFNHEVFFRGGSTSIITAKIYYDMSLPTGSTEQVLLDDIRQRVALISPRFGSDVLAVLASGSTKVFLILC